MAKYYTDEKNAQIVVALLKEHGIRKVIASPGTTNMPLVASMQNDPFFEMYSSVDERSAAYMACGLAYETGESIVISCTGATASRNYLPGLTEAYYRKLPILSITSTPALSKVGHNIAQVIDRSLMPKDTVRLSVALPIVKDEEDLWDCEIKVNKAILELRRYGGGPAHINLPTSYNDSYSTKELPKVSLINRITINDKFPIIPEGKVAIFLGSHSQMCIEQMNAIDNFCAVNNSIVLCDHTSAYKGKYRVLSAIAAGQQKLYLSSLHVDLLIYIGEISGDSFTKLTIRAKQVWRVNEDGEIKDLFKNLRYVFEMPEINFFNIYSQANDNCSSDDSYLINMKMQLTEIYRKIPDLPFSNVWVASKMAHLIPPDSIIHFAILNSLRSWNFFELPDSVVSSSNVGGFGIDGCLSTLVGASFANKNKLYFCIIGDLAFFYDLNVLGNRHLGNNLRIMIVNNGVGQEFINFNHPAAKWNEDASLYIAAGGHFGNKSDLLVKHYAENLGFEYICARTKKEFDNIYERFVKPDIGSQSIVFEVFTESEEESEALRLMVNSIETIQGKAKDMFKQVVGDKGLNAIKKIMYK